MADMNQRKAQHAGQLVPRTKHVCRRPPKADAYLLDRSYGCFDEVGVGQNFAWMAGVRHRVDYGSARRGRKLREALVVRFPDDVDVIERVEIAREIANPFACFQEIRQLDDGQLQFLECLQERRARANAISFERPGGGALNIHSGRCGQAPDRVNILGGKY
ncbi:hypothetical protein D3C72_1752200 [compost metagenome]